MPSDAWSSDAEQSREKLVLEVGDVPATTAEFELLCNFMDERGHFQSDGRFDTAEMLKTTRRA
jgi:hypothetical protein